MFAPPVLPIKHHKTRQEKTLDHRARRLRTAPPPPLGGLSAGRCRCGAVAWAGSYFAGAGAKKNARHGRPAAAVAAPVEATDMPVLVKAIGTVTPIDSSVIHAQLSGTIFSILFTEGQIVKQGQVIAQVDPRPYRLALASAQATLAKDQATLGAALLDLKRYETLAAQDSVARQTLDTQRATAVGQAQLPAVRGQGRRSHGAAQSAIYGGQGALHRPHRSEGGQRGHLCHRRRHQWHRDDHPHRSHRHHLAGRRPSLPTSTRRRAAARACPSPRWIRMV
jgi:hypothetical protein